MFKECTKCGVPKPLHAFSPQPRGKFGVTSICKPCTSLRGIAWHAANSERSRAGKAAYREANKARIAAAAKAWRERNAERLKAQAAKWTVANAEKKRASVAKRRAAKLQATPPWANLDDIKKFYVLAAKLTAETGIKAHVDHIVPLQAPTVCGLHCAANLSILPAHLNKRKGNLWWPQMPGRDPELDD